MKFLVYWALLYIFPFIVPVWAEDTSVGCGLGSFLIDDHRTIVSATARYSLNLLFFNQMFGVTSGTSNCGRYRMVSDPENQKRYFLAQEIDLKEALASSRRQAEVLVNFPLDPNLASHCYSQWAQWPQTQWQISSQEIVNAQGPKAWEKFQQLMIAPCSKI